MARRGRIPSSSGGGRSSGKGASGHDLKPCGPNGKRMLCPICQSDEHFRAQCPNQNGSSAPSFPALTARPGPSPGLSLQDAPAPSGAGSIQSGQAAVPAAPHYLAENESSIQHPAGPWDSANMEDPLADLMNYETPTGAGLLSVPEDQAVGHFVTLAPGYDHGSEAQLCMMQSGPTPPVEPTAGPASSDAAPADPFQLADRDPWNSGTTTPVFHPNLHREHPAGACGDERTRPAELPRPDSKTSFRSTQTEQTTASDWQLCAPITRAASSPAGSPTSHENVKSNQPAE